MYYRFTDDDAYSQALVQARREQSEAVVDFFVAIGRGLAVPLRAASRGVRQWWQRRRATRELQELDDRTLKDIGISRGEIGSVVGDMMAGRPRRRAAALARPAVAASNTPDVVVHQDLPSVPASQVPAAAGVVPAIGVNVMTSTPPPPRVLSADQKQLTFLLNCYDVWSATPARSYPCDQEAAVA